MQRIQMNYSDYHFSIEAKCNTPDKAFFFFFTEKYFFFYMKMCFSTHLKYLAKSLLMSTTNICFHGEIRKIL